MHIRDEEIKRLENYAKGLGTKVTYKPYTKSEGAGAGAQWVLYEDDTTELVLYTWPSQSKTLLILNFVHELAHHLSYIYKNRKDDTSTLQALFTEDERKKRADPILPKVERKLIYQMEKEDAKYRYNVWQEVDIKIPRWMLDCDVALDIWFYKQYYLNGNHPTKKQLDKKQNQLRKKFKLEQNEKQN